MAATARLIVMMRQEQKAALEEEARAQEVSTAELARRRLFGPADGEEEAFLEALAELGPVIQKTCQAVDNDLAEIRRLRETAAARDAEAAERAVGEVTVEELRAIADRLQMKPMARPLAQRRKART